MPSITFNPSPPRLRWPSFGLAGFFLPLRIFPFLSPPSHLHVTPFFIQAAFSTPSSEPSFCVKIYLPCFFPQCGALSAPCFQAWGDWSFPWVIPQMCALAKKNSSPFFFVCDHFRQGPICFLFPFFLSCPIAACWSFPAPLLTLLH